MKTQSRIINNNEFRNNLFESLVKNTIMVEIILTRTSYTSNIAAALTLSTARTSIAAILESLASPAMALRRSEKAASWLKRKALQFGSV